MAVKRGGNWNNGANAGLFSANLNNAPTDTNNNIGFRCCNNLSSQTCIFTEMQAVQSELHQSKSQFRIPSGIQKLNNKHKNAVGKMMQVLMNTAPKK